MLGRELGFSRTNFYRKVKALTGISPTDLLRVYRLNRAAELLPTREYTVGEVGRRSASEAEPLLIAIQETLRCFTASLCYKPFLAILRRSIKNSTMLVN